MIRFCLALISAAAGLLVLLPLLLAGLPFVLVARLTSMIARHLEPSALRWPQIFEFDPLLGWKAKSNLDCHLIEERDDIFHVVTDKFGWPGEATIAESEIVVFGDSHAWGYGVDHKATFSRLNPTLPVKAIGVPGYNLVQELLLMEQLAHQLKGKLVVWFVYTGNDLYDNLSPEMSGYRTPFVRQVNGKGEWEIVTRHLAPTKWRSSESAKLRRFYAVLPALHSDTFLAQRAYSACEFLLRKGAKICRDASARLIVMSIPSPAALSESHMQQLCVSRGFSKPVDPDLPDRKLGDICARHGISFVALKQHMSITHYKEHDDHWTEEGHQCIAEVLRRLYQDYRTTLLRSGSPGQFIKITEEHRDE